MLFVNDAISSRKQTDKEIAVHRLVHHNVEMISMEMLLFEILEDAKHPQFKEISALVK